MKLKKQYFKNRIKKEIAKKHKIVTGNDLWTFLGKSKVGKFKRILLDSKYLVVGYETWLNIISRNQVDKRTYKPQHFDCDDFAKIMYAYSSKEFEVNTCGLVLDWSGRHAYNLIICLDPQGELRLTFFEPQSDRFLTEDELFSGQYALQDGMIIL